MILQFLNGCCNINCDYQTNTSTFSSLVLPHGFIINLLKKFVTRLKTVSTLNGKVTPGESYSTYKYWFNAKGDKVLISPDRDQETILIMLVNIFQDQLGFLLKSILSLVLLQQYIKTRRTKFTKNKTLNPRYCKEITTNEKRALIRKEIESNKSGFYIQFILIKHRFQFS